jgi:hypothetical protein
MNGAMDSSDLIHPVYLPFTVEQLRTHLPPVMGRSAEQTENHVSYYTQSAAAYTEFCAQYPKRDGYSISVLRKPCQIEKDERFWTASCWLSLFHNVDRIGALTSVMERAFGPRPPLEGISDWYSCLTGKLHLFFEAQLPSPQSYKQWLARRIKDRHLIPYVLAASGRGGENFEGATHADALLLNETNGFAVIVEAKVASDISYNVSFDLLRNQLARTVDVALEHNHSLPAPLCSRDPSLTLVLLQTPELFKNNPHGRLYGWLFNSYKRNPADLARDLPHRSDVDWGRQSERLAWLTWEDCERILPGCCRWLAHNQV